jgi:hypothetical protein
MKTYLSTLYELKMGALLISVKLYKMEEAIPVYGLHIFQNTAESKFSCAPFNFSNG